MIVNSNFEGFLLEFSDSLLSYIIHVLLSSNSGKEKGRIFYSSLSLLFLLVFIT